MKTKKKSMAKTISALCIALAVFMLNSTYVFAAVCNKSPDGVHHFTKCEGGDIVTILGGTHQYVYGYDSENRPIYQDDCWLFYKYQLCQKKCEHCGTLEDGSTHSHLVEVQHGIDHN